MKNFRDTAIWLQSVFFTTPLARTLLLGLCAVGICLTFLVFGQNKKASAKKEHQHRKKDLLGSLLMSALIGLILLFLGFETFFQLFKH
ncbi:hypothetical protein ACQUEN_01610 [Lactococcus taiwanensis]|uniref:hypothetical protein n=1 Tax=Lactococcus taiwanensis TaxID=1151742 RepID=UPI003D13DA26